MELGDEGICHHRWHRMHHYGDGEPPVHYCPTGFDMCHYCGAVRQAPEDKELCQKWGEA